MRLIVFILLGSIVMHECSGFIWTRPPWLGSKKPKKECYKYVKQMTELVQKGLTKEELLKLPRELLLCLIKNNLVAQVLRPDEGELLWYIFL